MSSRIRVKVEEGLSSGEACMRALAFGAALSVATVCAAYGADIAPLPGPPPAPPPTYAPVQPPFTWTGIYVGGNAGYGFATGTLTVAGLGSSSSSLSGFVGGGQIGANYQFGIGVIGIEGEFDATSQKFTTSAFGATLNENIPWEGNGRLRFGAALDRFLIYVTGGAGYGQFTASASVPGVGTASATQNAAFFVGGVGAEYAFTNNLSARVEYLYLDTGNVALATVAGASVTGRVQDNIVRAGINFRFGL